VSFLEGKTLLLIFYFLLEDKTLGSRYSFVKASFKLLAVVNHPKILELNFEFENAPVSIEDTNQL